MEEVNKIISEEISRGKDKAKDIKLMCSDLQTIKNIAENKVKNNGNTMNAENVFFEYICNAYYLGLERGFTGTSRMEKYMIKKEDFDKHITK